MNTKMLLPIGFSAIAAAVLGCATPPSDIAKKKTGTNEVFNEDPTKEASEKPGAYNGGTKNTFDHFADLGAEGARDPFDILAQREEEGPAEVRTRLHSCQKIPYATLKNILVSLGVDMDKTSDPPSAGQLYNSGAGALGVANYDARVGETLVWSAAGAARLFDIFVQAAPEIIANIESADHCKVNGVGTPMFDVEDRCNADAVSCIIGRPATSQQIEVCSHLVKSASDITKGKNIAVATMLSAAHSCE
jgi:hypothetical protein